MRRSNGLMGLSLGLIVVACVGSSAASASSDWTDLAVRLTGESGPALARVLARLESYPKRDDVLRTALRAAPTTLPLFAPGPRSRASRRFFLALDVIAALRLREFIPDLVRVSANEPSGYAYGALNTLLSMAEKPEMAGLYAARLSDLRTSEPARAILLDTLGRWQEPIPRRLLELRLSDRERGVQSAALGYLRARLLGSRSPDAGLLALLRPLFRSDVPGLRAQALSIASELGGLAREARQTGPAPEACSSGLRASPGPSREIRVVFGYKDARPARFVGDRYESLVFIQELLAPCADERVVCGFERRGEALVKGRVRVRVTTSSAGPDDDDNRRNPFQDWQTRRAQCEFADALTHADVALYNGHSRAGGGPDFGPPLLDRFRHVRYAWYRHAQPGLRAAERALRGAPGTRLQALGLFSCASAPLFKKRLERARPGLHVVGSGRLIYFADSIEESLEMLSRELATGRP